MLTDRQTDRPHLHFLGSSRSQKWDIRSSFKIVIIIKILEGNHIIKVDCGEWIIKKGWTLMYLFILLIM